MYSNIMDMNILMYDLNLTLINKPNTYCIELFNQK